MLLFREGFPMTLCDCSAVLAVVMRNVCMTGDQHRPPNEKNQPKSIKSQSELIQEKKSFPGPSKSSKGLCFGGALLAALGRRWVPFGPELHPKGVPQS